MKRVVILSLLTLGITTLAHAQATRTWVSGVGDDVNPCSRTAPCKTFAGAISKTATNGIINCLDPGGFGTVTITKGITIDCTGTMGSVLASGVPGVTVNGVSTTRVVLRAIDINGTGTTFGTNGVNVITAQDVSLYYVNIANFTNANVEMTNSANLTNLFFSNCEFLNSTQGVLLANSGTGIAKAQGDNTTIQGNGTGLHLQGANASTVMTRCNISHNTSTNVQADVASNFALFESCSITTAPTGVNMQNGSTGRFSSCFIAGNTTNGILGTGTICHGNNVIAGNIGGTTCATTNAGLQ